MITTNLITIILIFLQTSGRLMNSMQICNSKCSPDDEFENLITTEQWDAFMEEMDGWGEGTSFPCENNSQENVNINITSEFFWKTRYQVYSTTTNSVGQTINDCYCDYSTETECQMTEFRKCLANVRTSMTKEFKSAMLDIQDELSSQC